MKIIIGLDLNHLIKEKRDAFLRLKSEQLKKNMGTTDRLIRSGIALLLAVLYTTGMISGTWEIAIMVLAVIMLLTSVAGVCPLYGIFGVNTCRKRLV